MICPKCNRQLPDGVKFCTYCGSPLMQNTPQYPMNTPAQNPPVPMSQVNVQINQKNVSDKKRNIAVPLIVSVLLVAAIVCGIIFLPDLLDKKGNSSEGEDGKGGSSKGTSLAVIDQSVQGTSEDNKYEILSAVLDKNEDGKDVVVVTVKYSRLNGDPYSFHLAAESWTQFVYQNGIALSGTDDYGEFEKKYGFDFDDVSTTIKAGSSIEIIRVFELRDATTDIVVEIRDGSYDSDYIVSKTFKIN